MSRRVNEHFTPAGVSQYSNIPMTTAAQFHHNNLAATPTMQAGNISEFPEELVVEIMQWCMRSDETEISTRSLGSTCSRLSQLLRTHLAGPWYKQFRSEVMHRRANEFVKSYVSEVRSRFMPYFNSDLEDELKPSDLKNLASKLHWQDEMGACRTFLKMERVDRSAGDWLQAFREYDGPSLPLSCNEITPATNALVELVEKALPPRVCLHLEMAGYGEQDREQGFADHIANICSGGRMLVLEVYYFNLLLPASKAAILGAMCGKGFVPVVYLYGINSKQMLSDLKDYCNHFRHVKLLILDIYGRHGNTIDIPALTEFMEALEERKRNGHSSMSVVLINSNSDEALGFTKATLKKNPAIREDLQVFFGRGDRLNPRESWMQKVAATVGQGVIDPWDPDSIVQPAESDFMSSHEFYASEESSAKPEGLVPEAVQARPRKLQRRSSDSDSIVASSDDESSAESSSSEIEKPAPVSNRAKARKPSQKPNRVKARSPGQSRRPDIRTHNEPKVKKRDKCVIS